MGRPLLMNNREVICIICHDVFVDVSKVMQHVSKDDKILLYNYLAILMK